ncbi:MAG: hypothetical protein IPK32_15895 [Verrucomicrobiaceae bacterium]|nr:hypothetical protein [Verrucomicrobiaceae bacterium]
MSIHEWHEAFLLTQIVEVPVYLLAGRELPLPKRVLYAFGASTITHPIIWFGLPWAGGPYLLLFLVAETFAVMGEALWGLGLGVRRPWMAALLANTASVCAGLVIRHVF